MRFALFPQSLVAVVVACAALSIYSLRAALLSASAVESTRAAIAAVPRGGDKPLEHFSEQSQEALQSSVKVASETGRVSDILQAGAWLSERARLSPNQSDRVESMCEALSVYGQGLARTPRDTRLLIAFASQRQLLGGYVCSQAQTQGEVGEMVDRALYWDPYDREVLFWGARLKLWIQQREQALSLFHRLLRYSSSLTPGQSIEVLGELNNAADFREVVPAIIPQVTRWSSLLRERRPGDFALWRKEIAASQQSAIDEVRGRLESLEIPRQLFERALRDLEEVAATDAVRQKIDHELSISAALRGASEEADFLEQRSKLSALEVVRAQASSDTRPSANSLVRWGDEQQVAFDDFYQTVGFYLPPQQGVSLITLRGQNAAEALDPRNVRLFASDDNEHWIEVASLKVELVSVGSEELLAIIVPVEGHRYWKVHNSSPIRRKQFGGTLFDLLQVYGNSSRSQESL